MLVFADKLDVGLHNSVVFVDVRERNERQQPDRVLDFNAGFLIVVISLCKRSDDRTWSVRLQRPVLLRALGSTSLTLFAAATGRCVLVVCCLVLCRLADTFILSG